MKFYIKKLIVFFAMLCMVLSASACTTTNKPVTGRYAKLTPDSFIFKYSDGFEFVQLYTDVTEMMLEEKAAITPLIAYITDNSLDIDGDNEAKEIHLKFEVWPIVDDSGIEATVTLLMKYIANPLPFSSLSMNLPQLKVLEQYGMIIL